jgi:hypothetical protein
MRGAAGGFQLFVLSMLTPRAATGHYRLAQTLVANINFDVIKSAAFRGKRGIEC